MKEPIVVDMALAYQQMKTNPEIVKMINRLFGEATQEVAFSGWMVRHRNRTLDANKNPTTEWSVWYYRSAHRSRNPYVYQKGRHYSKDEVKQHPQYDYNGAPPRPTAAYGSPEYNAWSSAYNIWNKNKPILGYREVETQVVPAKIVVDV